MRGSSTNRGAQHLTLLLSVARCTRQGQASEGLRDVVLAVASAAKAHLDEARALRGSLPRQAAPTLLGAVACSNLLALLERRDFNALDPALLSGPGVSPLWYVLQLKWHLLRGSY